MKFVNKELAIKLKEKGFNKPCFGWYYINIPAGRSEDELILNTSNTRGVAYEDLLHSHNETLTYYPADRCVDAPTLEQILEWLREKDIYIWIQPYNTHTTKNHVAFIWNITLGTLFKSKEQLFDKDTFYTHIHLDIEHWEVDYDDAILAGIDFVLNTLL